MSTIQRPRVVACERCHRRKVKCVGGTPCRNCHMACEPCVYPNRDRLITVSEAYVRSLETIATSFARQEPSRFASHNRHLCLQDSTAESFVLALKKVEAARDLHNDQMFEPQISDPSCGEAASIRRYDYVPLSFDSSDVGVAVKLPPWPYANQLVQQFELFVGFDYHWYYRAEFYRRLDTVFRDPRSPYVRDRVWLCQLFVVFALGASYFPCIAPSIELFDSNDSGHSGYENGNGHSYEPQDTESPIPPGAEFFEQALKLFKFPIEEYHVSHVEVLNLMSFYSYSLNRHRTAYMYAGLAQEIAQGLMLHETAVSFTSSSAIEHDKRVWWTMFIMESFTATVMGVKPSMKLCEISLPWPDNVHLAPSEQADFTDGSLLTANIRLQGIQIDILSLLNGLRGEEDLAKFATAIQPLLVDLAKWTAALPLTYTFDFSVETPPSLRDMQERRSVASLYIRYHQASISLLRPVFFKVLASALSMKLDNEVIDLAIQMSTQCLKAARSNLIIFAWLSAHERLAKYGFWESLHLCSSLTVVLLVRIVNIIRLDAITPGPDDDALLAEGKALLKSMAIAGNRAAKGHVDMLEEVQKLVDRIGWSSLQSSLNSLQWTDPFGLSNSCSWDYSFASGSV